jgi:hypothetical protein
MVAKQPEDLPLLGKVIGTPQQLERELGGFGEWRE